MDRNGRLRLLDVLISWSTRWGRSVWTALNCRELSWTVVSSLNLLDARNQKCCFETVSSSLDLCKRFSCALWCTMMHYAWLLPSRSKLPRKVQRQTITLDIFGSVKHLWSCADHMEATEAQFWPWFWWFFWRTLGWLSWVTLWGSLGKALDVVLDRLDPARLVKWFGTSLDIGQSNWTS